MDPRVAEALWKAIEGHLPPRPPRQPPTGLPPAAHPGPGLLRRHLGQARHRLLMGRRSPALPGRLGHRRSEPQRQHPARTHPAAVADRGLLLDIETLHLDRGYDSKLTTQRCHGLGLTDIVCAKKKRKGEAKIKKPLTLGLRWPVERTNSWLSNFGQLRRNTDRFSRQRLGQVALAVALILTVKLVKWAKRWTD